MEADTREREHYCRLGFGSIDRGGLLTTRASASGAEPGPRLGNDSAVETTEAIFVSNVIFTDGFETSDTTAWSTAVP